jgi:hypothetical protein
MAVESLRTRSLGWRRLAAEMAFLAAMGAFIAMLGAFGSDNFSVVRRYSYWIVNLVAGGLIGIAIDQTVRRWPISRWRRVWLVSAAMTPPVTLFVLGSILVILGNRSTFENYVGLLWQVFVIALPAMAARELVWSEVEPRIETRTIVVPPLPEAEAAFRRRLSAKRRSARLIAIEAYDHYLRVHTDQGEELITLRFADALAELALAHGYRTHRSWWVAADAIESVTWRRGTGEARLVGGLTVPVSRGQAPVLKDAGWL